ncbi:MAG: M23 family metallopeptidase [Fibrobacter sp.]|nr:M23 family metallopeptidase [Fibrobacter sp.]MBQ5463739.1 M23 family metallopeptidase [Fibrobacter sp.]
MKKLEVHIYPNKDSRGRDVTFSVRKVAIYLVLTICAILGFIMFSPVQIVENLSNGNLMDVYHQNSVIKDEIKKIRTVVDTTILKIEETRIVRDSTMKLGGLGFTLEGASVEDEMPRKNLQEMRATFRNTLNKLERDSALAAHIPVLHPLKNHHDIKSRFEMVFDAFTDQELPHRGVDFLAADGDTVYAPGAGTVVEVRKHRGYGLTMKIEHMEHVKTFYAHLGKTLLDKGDKVRRGDPIATIGKSGLESSLGLHYEIRVNGVPVNPEDYFITK